MGAGSQPHKKLPRGVGRNFREQIDPENGAGWSFARRPFLQIGVIEARRHRMGALLAVQQMMADRFVVAIILPGDALTNHQ
jgi:hypothetical protein